MMNAPSVTTKTLEPRPGAGKTQGLVDAGDGNLLKVLRAKAAARPREIRFVAPFEAQVSDLLELVAEANRLGYVWAAQAPHMYGLAVVLEIA